MPATGRIVESAMRLRAESHEGWNEFVLAMREYSAATTSEMLRCPPEALARAQGMALAAHDIATTLMNAPKLYEKARNNG
jgi:hypothetical protein